MSETSLELTDSVRLETSVIAAEVPYISANSAAIADYCKIGFRMEELRRDVERFGDMPGDFYRSAPYCYANLSFARS